MIFFEYQNIFWMFLSFDSRHSVGVHPTTSLNCRLKLDLSLKPTT